MQGSSQYNINKNRLANGRTTGGIGVGSTTANTGHYPSASSGYGRTMGVGQPGLLGRKVEEKKESGLREQSSLGSTAYRNGSTRVSGINNSTTLGATGSRISQ